MVNLMKKVKEYSIVFINTMKNKINNNKVSKSIYVALLLFAPYLGAIVLGLDSCADAETDLVSDHIADKTLDKATDKLKENKFLGQKYTMLTIRLVALVCFFGLHLLLNKFDGGIFLNIIKTLVKVLIVALVMILFQSFLEEDKIDFDKKTIIRRGRKIKRMKKNFKNIKNITMRLISGIIHIGIPMSIYFYLLIDKSIKEILVLNFISICWTTFNSANQKRKIIKAKKIDKNDAPAYVFNFFKLANEGVPTTTGVKIFISNIIGLACTNFSLLIEVGKYSINPNLIIKISSLSVCVDILIRIFIIIAIPSLMYIGRDIGSLIALKDYPKLRKYITKFMIYRSVFSLFGISLLMIITSITLLNYYKICLELIAIIIAFIVLAAVSLVEFSTCLQDIVECEKDINKCGNEYVKYLRGKVNRVNRHQSVKC